MSTAINSSYNSPEDPSIQEDFDAFDEFDEFWDDDLEEESLELDSPPIAESAQTVTAIEKGDNSEDLKNTPPRKKKVVIALLAVVSCSGLYGYYQYTSQAQKTPIIPSIKIEHLAPTTSKHITEQNINIHHDDTNTENVSYNSADKGIPASITPDLANTETLTPWPDTINTKMSPLPELPRFEKNTPQEQTDELSIPKEDTTQTTNITTESERDFIKKTEDTYEAHDNSDSHEATLRSAEESPIQPENAKNEANTAKIHTEIETITVQTNHIPDEITTPSDMEPSEFQPVPPKKPQIKSAIKESAPAVSIINWEIKAIQPNRAVLFDPKTSTMKTVEIGDFVKELGKIQSISKNDGKWIVKGSKRSISK